MQLRVVWMRKIGLMRVEAELELSCYSMKVGNYNISVY